MKALVHVVSWALTLVLTSSVFGEVPLTYVRPGKGGCPPGGPANLGGDKNISGHAPPANDFLMASFHWDDGQGNDLTLEEWCISGPLAYFSERVVQSKNGVETPVVVPNGLGGTVDPGPC